jgi:hypothetical protein
MLRRTIGSRLAPVRTGPTVASDHRALSIAMSILTWEHKERIMHGGQTTGRRPTVSFGNCVVPLLLVACLLGSCARAPVSVNTGSSEPWTNYKIGELKSTPTGAPMVKWLGRTTALAAFNMVMPIKVEDIGEQPPADAAVSGSLAIPTTGPVPAVATLSRTLASIADRSVSSLPKMGRFHAAMPSFRLKEGNRAETSRHQAS